MEVNADVVVQGSDSSSNDSDVEAQRISYASKVNITGSRPSLENRGFARAMMKQMPSKLALSAGNIANLSYGKSRSDLHPPGELKAASLDTCSSIIRATPSLLRYEKDVNKLVQIIENEMEAQLKSVLNEDRKNTRLRELSASLTVKRRVHRRLKENMAQLRSAEKQTRLNRLSTSLGRVLVLTKRYVFEAHDLVHIWHEQLKSIEGNFGQNVGLYFRFMRWLLVVNMVVFLISVVFLVIPQMLLSAFNPDEANRSAQGMRPPRWPRPRLAALERPMDPFSFSNLITGQGWFLMTPMYYGYYYRDTIRLTTGGGYHMPAAYLYITGICITIQLIILAISTARSYRKNFIDVTTDNSGNLANLILAGWDARVTSPRLAELKRLSLYTSFKRKLERKAAEEEEARLAPESEAAAAQRRRRQRMLTILGRVGVNGVVLAALAGISALTWLVMKLDEGEKDGAVSLLASALMISSSMAVFPVFFQWLGSLEKLNRYQRALMFITLIRMVLMAIVIISTIVTYWVYTVNSFEHGSKQAKVKRGKKRCWENEVGSELYQLVLTDLLFMVFFESGLEFARKIAYKHGVTMLGEPHFDIPRSTTFLIYNQTLVWAGAYFSPVLSFIGCCKLVIMFYVRKWSLWYNCQPQARSVRASQTQTVFRVVAFSVCFLAASFTGYIVFNVTPSQKCGPFQGRVAPWVILNDTLNSWRDEGHTFIYSIVVWSHRPGVVAIWILAFSVVAYYLRSLALARQEMIELLRGQLTLEGQDKVVLLQFIDDAAAKLEDVRKQRHDMETVRERAEEEPIIFEAPKDLQILLAPKQEESDATASGSDKPEKAEKGPGKPEHRKLTMFERSKDAKPVRSPSRSVANFWSRYGANRHRRAPTPRRQPSPHQRQQSSPRRPAGRRKGKGKGQP